MRTATKIKLASWLYQGFSKIRGFARKGPRVHVQRNGYHWSLDLDEGIDFAIYLGIFERSTRKALGQITRPGDTVLDIGANIGAHTFYLAQCVGPQGQVIAFEPTDFAFDKLRVNADQNPTLRSRIILEQIMLTSRETDLLQKSVYASWPLKLSDDLHAQHRGKRMSTSRATAESLDDYLKRSSINRVDVIKIDVDGHELQVLSGSTNCLRRFHPKLVMEFAPYVHKDEHSNFEDLIRLLEDFNYRYRDLGSMKLRTLHTGAVTDRIPEGSSLNVILEAK